MTADGWFSYLKVGRLIVGDLTHVSGNKSMKLLNVELCAMSDEEEKIIAGANKASLDATERNVQKHSTELSSVAHFRGEQKHWVVK